MALTITNRNELITAISTLDVLVAAEQGAFDGLFSGGGGGEAVTVDTLTGATATGKSVMKATDAAAARTAIGAGTSSLAVGTTAVTAKAGNYTPTSAEVSTALKAKAQITALTTVATPDATDEATAITLVNALKVSVNAIIAALKA